MQYKLLIITLLFSLVVINSCKKELPPKPDNYNQLYNPETTIIDLTIPCEDNLQDNYYSTSVSIDWYDSFYVYDTNTYEAFEYYQISALHYNTSARIEIAIPDYPGSYSGRRLYNISPSNYVGTNHAKFLFKYGWSITCVPVEEDVIYIDFTDTSLNISFCNITLRDDYNNEIDFTGKIIHYY